MERKILNVYVQYINTDYMYSCQTNLSVHICICKNIIPLSLSIYIYIYKCVAIRKELPFCAVSRRKHMQVVF